MVAALACGGVALYGFTSNAPSRDWKKDDVALVQDSETGGHFLYFADGTGKKKLYPVTNYLSARLILPEGFRVRTMPTVNTDGVLRGPQVGLESVGWSFLTRTAQRPSAMRSSPHCAPSIGTKKR